MKKLLLTAFEPFAGEKLNPSMEAARQMERVDFPGTLIRVTELPVDRYRAVAGAIELIDSWKPDLVIMLGEAGGRFRVNPERVAINIDDFRIADNAGNQPTDEPIVEGGPAAYFSTLPIREITERIIKAKIPAAISNTAGTYLCNRLFYAVMHSISVEGWSARAGLIHLPYLHDQTLTKHQDVPSLSRESLVEAVRLAIEVSVAAATKGESRRDAAQVPEPLSPPVNEPVE